MSEAAAARDAAEQRLNDVRRRFDQLTVELDALKAEHGACERRRSSTTSQDDPVYETASARDSLTSGLLDIAS